MAKKSGKKRKKMYGKEYCKTTKFAYFSGAVRPLCGKKQNGGRKPKRVYKHSLPGL